MAVTIIFEPCQLRDDVLTETDFATDQPQLIPCHVCPDSYRPPDRSVADTTPTRGVV